MLVRISLSGMVLRLHSIKWHGPVLAFHQVAWSCACIPSSGMVLCLHSIKWHGPVLAFHRCGRFTQKNLISIQSFVDILSAVITRTRSRENISQADLPSEAGVDENDSVPQDVPVEEKKPAQRIRKKEFPMKLPNEFLDELMASK